MNENFDEEQCEIENEEDVAICIYGEDIMEDDIDLNGDINNYDYQQDLYNQW